MGHRKNPSDSSNNRILQVLDWSFRFGHEGTFQWSDDTNNRPINFTRYTGREASGCNINCNIRLHSQSIALVRKETIKKGPQPPAGVLPGFCGVG